MPEQLNRGVGRPPGGAERPPPAPQLPPDRPRRACWTASWTGWHDPSSSGRSSPPSATLRRLAPVLPLGRRVIVSRHADVVDVLRRDADFTVAEVNGPSMNRWSGSFILGTDRGEAYDREVAVLRRAAPAGDIPRIRRLVADNAAGLVDAARPNGRLDIVHGPARVVATRTVVDYYGVAGPDEATMMRWTRALFDPGRARRRPRLGPHVRVGGAAVPSPRPDAPAIVAWGDDRGPAKAGAGREGGAGERAVRRVRTLVFPHPGGFRPDRPEEGYLHFGHGMHTCFGLA